MMMAAVLLALAAGWASAQAPDEARPRLNVVLIILDDVRWDALGAAGNRVVRTPRIDELAREGVRFEQARVTTSICMVSRATLLTGQYMSRHGITAFGRAIAPEPFASTYPALLRRAGYWTGYVGKYGIGPPRRGDFDFLRAYEGAHWMTGDGGERIHVTGTLVSTYHATTHVTLPRASDFPGLTPCQRQRVQDAIDNVLAPHEQEHVEAFRT